MNRQQSTSLLGKHHPESHKGEGSRLSLPLEVFPRDTTRSSLALLRPRFLVGEALGHRLGRTSPYRVLRKIQGKTELLAAKENFCVH